MGDEVDFNYKRTDFYRHADEGGIIWNDSFISIERPIAAPVQSDKDMNYPGLGEIGAEDLPQVTI